MKGTFVRSGLAALTGLALAGFLAGSGPSLADEADCADLRLELDAKVYDVSCELEGLNLEYGQTEAQIIDAIAKDGSHFVYAVDLVAPTQSYFEDNGNLRETMENFLGSDNISNWRKGEDVDEIARTAEFTGDVKGIRSACVGFRVNASRLYGGWKRIIFGVACGRNAKVDVYKALADINFPG